MKRKKNRYEIAKLTSLSVSLPRDFCIYRRLGNHIWSIDMTVPIKINIILLGRCLPTPQSSIRIFDIPPKLPAMYNHLLLTNKFYLDTFAPPRPLSAPAVKNSQLVNNAPLPMSSYYTHCILRNSLLVLSMVILNLCSIMIEGGVRVLYLFFY